MSNENQHYTPPDEITGPTEKEKPSVLYRGYTVGPEELSVNKFNETLTPRGIDNESGERLDSNEIGVYMSTNSSMVETSYTHGSRLLEVPIFNDGNGNQRYLNLPVCGVLLEINTNEIQIRSPEIDPSLRGVYNNGFEGDEWVADTISPKSYKVLKFIINKGPNDSKKTVIEIDNNNPNSLSESIEKARDALTNYEEISRKYAEFLENTPEAVRLNQFKLKKSWEEYSGSRNIP